MPSNLLDQVVFWGPVKSGKTWLFNAFLKKIEILNRKLKPLDFSFIAESNGAEVGHIETLMNEPTTGIYERKYIFVRKKLGDDFVAKVNTQSHEVLVVDNTGGAFGSAFGTTEMDEKRKDFAWEKVRTARFLVLALNSGYEENATSGTIVKQLRDLLKVVKESDGGKYIAACLTKVDTLGEELVIEFYNQDKSQLRGLLIRSFGKEYVDQIYEGLNALQMDGKNHVESFATSATGYFNNNGKKNRNISGDGGTLADSANWYPEEVEKPFFWLFDVVERERLRYLSGGYSLFSKIMGNKTITETRQSAYASYSQLIRLAKMVENDSRKS